MIHDFVLGNLKYFSYVTFKVYVVTTIWTVRKYRGRHFFTQHAMGYFWMFPFFSPTNMIAQSQSGTGKTAAFVLTMLSRVDATKPYPQVRCSQCFFPPTLGKGPGTFLIGKKKCCIDQKLGIFLCPHKFIWAPLEFTLGRCQIKVHNILSP